MVLVVALVCERAVHEVCVVQGGGAGGFQQTHAAAGGALLRAAHRAPHQPHVVQTTAHKYEQRLQLLPNSFKTCF